MKYLFQSKITTKPIAIPAHFMDLSQNCLTHCPKCSKPLLNSGQFSGWAEFSMRCPWCQATVLVSIQPKITTSIKLESQSGLNPAPVAGHSSKRE